MFSRILKLSISIFFFSVAGVFDRIGSVLGSPRAGTCVVLYYHAVAHQHRSKFARQMDILLRYTKPVPADRSAPPSPGEHLAAVTFDDGFEGILHNALPELEKRGIPAVFFIVVDCLGKSLNWGKEQAGPISNEKIMSVEQLRRLPSSVIIGSHSLTHPNLCKIDPERSRNEIVESRRRLQQISGAEITLFSFPYGSFDGLAVDYCLEAGYNRIFSTLPVLAFTRPQEFLTGRISVEPTDWPLEFTLKLLGGYRWLPLAFSFKRKVKSGLRFQSSSEREIGDQAKRPAYIPSNR